MKYNFNGKEINIPDAEIEKSMKLLDISKEEAIEMWLDDNDYTENEEVEKLTEKAKEVKRYEKADKPRKATKKERKVDEEKKNLLNLCRIPIEGAGGIVTNVTAPLKSKNQRTAQKQSAIFVHNFFQKPLDKIWRAWYNGGPRTGACSWSAAKIQLYHTPAILSSENSSAFCTKIFPKFVLYKQKKF